MTSNRLHSPLSLLSLLRSARPHQWVKNVFVFAPLVFSQRLAHIPSLLDSLMAFAGFCAAASAIYYLNDLRDIEKDRCHPIKCRRPIPAGEISQSLAFAVALLLTVIALGTTYAADQWAAFLIAIYMILNLAYSFGVKKIPYLDVSVIATGFALRVSVGAFAIGVMPSAWILLNTFGLAMFLGFGKRYHEMMVYGNSAARQRPVLKRYNRGVVFWIMSSLTLTVPTLFLLYTLSPDAREKGFTHLGLTTPLILLSLIRFMGHAGDQRKRKSPTELILRDPLFISITIGWSALVVWLIY